MGKDDDLGDISGQFEGASEAFEAIEGFSRFSTVLAGFRSQLIGQGFSDETADSLVALTMTQHLEEARHNNAMKEMEFANGMNLNERRPPLFGWR